MKLLLDEQISGKVADRLRKRGHDVIAATDDRSPRGSSDPDLFEVAQQQGRAVVTYNLRMEPAGHRAEVRLTIWPGGEDRLLARAGYHGTPVELFPARL